MEELLKILNTPELVDIKHAAIIMMLSHVACCVCSATSRKAKMLITMCASCAVCGFFECSGEHSIITPLVAVIMYDLGYKKFINILKNKGDE